MFTRGEDLQHGLDALREALASALDTAWPSPAPALANAAGGSPAGRGPGGWLWAEAVGYARGRSAGSTTGGTTSGAGGPNRRDPDDQAGHPTSSVADEHESARLISLVELARGGDAEAFGMLYDHYHTAVYRFVYYRVGSVVLAEDLVSETFFRALRSMSSFRWQGKDFGAWLVTIARNLTADHFKAGRTRLEQPTEDMGAHDATTDGPENAVLAQLTNEVLLEALRELPDEQQECLVMRFLQGFSIAETAQVLERSEGAVKQLQLRGVRNLAKLLPEGMR